MHSNVSLISLKFYIFPMKRVLIITHRPARFLISLSRLNIHYINSEIIMDINYNYNFSTIHESMFYTLHWNLPYHSHMLSSIRTNISIVTSAEA